MQTSRGICARGWDERSGADPSASAATSGCGTTHLLSLDQVTLMLQTVTEVMPESIQNSSAAVSLLPDIGLQPCLLYGVGARWQASSSEGWHTHNACLCVLQSSGQTLALTVLCMAAMQKPDQEHMHKLPYGKGILKLNPETQMRSEQRTVSLKGNLWGQPAINWKVLIEYAIDCTHIRQLPVYYTLWAV